MPRPTSQSSNWDFAVAPTRLHLPDGSPSSVFANVRKDSNAVVGVVSEKGYGLIQNQDFVGSIRSALTSLGLDGYSENVVVTQGGSRLFATYTFNNRVSKIHGVNDTVGMRLRFANSFDRGLAASGQVMALVLRCLNGMMLERGDFSLQERHSAKISLDFIKEVIAESVKSFDASLAVFSTLAQVKISDEDGVNIIKNLPMSEKSREGIIEIWGNPNFAQTRENSLYSLYDATTEFLRDLENARLEHAAKVNRSVLSQLVKAIDPAYLKTLTARVIDTSVVVTEAV